MIRRIKGEVIDVGLTSVVIDVNGIGYLIATTAVTTAVVGETLLLHTHLAVRENALDLYGFRTQDELSFFELLLTLPKIGPKTALQILSQADISLIQNAIISQDVSHLSKMSGLSKKTAEKIVLGLKDSFDSVSYQSKSGVDKGESNSALMSDTIDALVTLGYPQADARKSVQQLMSDHPEITKVNDAIKEVLKILG
jgi:Holliday junction DNA helicase RuvA